MTDVSAATSSDQRPVLADAHGEPSAAMESTSAPVIPEEYHENATVAMREVLDGLREYVETWSQKTRETTERLGEEVSNRAQLRVGGWDDPIILNGDPRENMRIEDLVSCENALLGKSTMIFAQLGGEVERLRTIANETIFPMLMTFGERAHDEDEDKVSEAELRTAFVEKLQPLQDTLLFMDQVRAVICNLFTQLTVVYSTFTAYTPYQSVRLQWSFDMLGRALAIGLGIDETVRNNKTLGMALMSFKRVVLVLRTNPEQFGMNEVDVASLDSSIVIVEKLLFSSSFFSSILEQLAGTEQPDRFIKELAAVTLELIERASDRVNSDKERLSDKNTLLSSLCLTCLHSHLVPDITDRQLCTKAWEVHNLCLLVPVTTTVSVCPGTILDAHLSPGAREFRTATLSETIASRHRQMLDTIDDSFPEKLRRFLSQSVCWLAKFTAVQAPSSSLSVTMSARIRLLQEGTRCASQLRHYIQEVLHLHMVMDAPLTRQRVRLIAQAVEMLQAMYDAFTQNTKTSLELQHLLKFLQDRLIRLLVPAQELLENTLSTMTTTSGWGRVKAQISAGKVETNKQDVLANLHIAGRVLSGPATQKRTHVLRVCLDSICGARIMSSENECIAHESVELLEALCRYRKSIQDQCDTSFLFLTRELFPVCLSEIYARPNEAGRLNALVNAFRGCETLLMRGGAKPDEMAAYQHFIENSLEREIIQPLCRDIETDLRMHLHSARIIGIASMNPFKDGVRDLSAFTILPPIRMLNYQIDIKNRVEEYLNKTFHNHTAIALHNWKSYVEMRNLAIEKYSLRCAEIELPSQTLEQGLDVLELMRNIHIFVSKYNYNLNTQCFVEKASADSDRKHLNTISIRHVANSIRTHGTGITHTSINFAYQYLAQRFQIFNQFLFDDHIRSQLMKEARMVHAETKAKSDAIKLSAKQTGYRASKLDEKFEYPVESALRLIRDVRKLGLSSDGSSFIDQFRDLVTEIGNALGFVRMIRLGAMHYSTNAAKFVPSTHTAKFSADASFAVDGLSDWTVKCLKNLQNELEALNVGGTDGTDYFQVLVSVFSTELRNKAHEHLKDFYLVLPALTLSAAEAISASKDKLARRTKESLTATFTDDGLALGIAYLLSVLGQHEAFDALHWFESAASHFEAEKKRAEGDNKRSLGILGRTSDEKTKLQAKLDKIDALKREFIHLEHSLIGARSFVNV